MDAFYCFCFIWVSNAVVSYIIMFVAVIGLVVAGISTAAPNAKEEPTILSTSYEFKCQNFQL